MINDIIKDLEFELRGTAKMFPTKSDINGNNLGGLLDYVLRHKNYIGSEGVRAVVTIEYRHETGWDMYAYKSGVNPPTNEYLENELKKRGMKHTGFAVSMPTKENKESQELEVDKNKITKILNEMLDFNTHHKDGINAIFTIEYKGGYSWGMQLYEKEEKTPA